ncbi:hypothetical protein GOBAR_DD25830 [Gossypium barbadense]|nr:hypothetical protein GOBAR_DD25830 [Gossypium barbadense]
MSPVIQPSPSWSHLSPTMNTWASSYVNHPTQHVVPSSSVVSYPYTLIATPNTVEDPAWYPNSGATHHLTHSAASLSENLSYNEPGMVYVGNGSSLTVICSGQSSLLTKARPLYMKSILYTLGITKYLLSISKFTRENQVMFEFLPSQCQVRDLRTREIILRGSV